MNKDEVQAMSARPLSPCCRCLERKNARGGGKNWKKPPSISRQGPATRWKGSRPHSRRAGFEPKALFASWNRILRRNRQGCEGPLSEGNRHEGRGMPVQALAKGATEQIRIVTPEESFGMTL